MKGIYETTTTTANIVSNGKRLGAFSLAPGRQKWYSFQPFPFNTVLEIHARIIMQKN